MLHAIACQAGAFSSPDQAFRLCDSSFSPGDGVSGTGTPRPVTAPVVPIKTGIMKCNEEVWAKLVEKHPQMFAIWAADQITKGKMSIEEVAKLFGG